MRYNYLAACNKEECDKKETCKRQFSDREGIDMSKACKNYNCYVKMPEEIEVITDDQ